jgi:pyrrolidone-carboxylate peptidase
MKIVITGFGKFNGVENNPTTELVAHFASEFQTSYSSSNNKVECKVLEVSCGAVDEFYAASNFDFKNTVFIHLGVHGRAKSIILEQQGWNDKTFRCPDERGYNPDAVKICSDLDLYSTIKSNFR